MVDTRIIIVCICLPSSSNSMISNKNNNIVSVVSIVNIEKIIDNQVLIIIEKESVNKYLRKNSNKLITTKT